MICEKIVQKKSFKILFEKITRKMACYRPRRWASAPRATIGAPGLGSSRAGTPLVGELTMGPHMPLLVAVAGELSPL
jgi:hypothetical protein